MADDYPHITKSVSLMVFDLIDKFKQNIVGVGDLTWHEDGEMLAEQKYLYGGIFGEVLGMLNEMGGGGLKVCKVGVEVILENCR
jgi:hypothetical protein